jgi:hypothetical protein
VGEDTVVIESRTLALIQSCVNPIVIRHPGGHSLPSGLEAKAEIVDFVKNHSPSDGIDVASLDIGRI